MVHISIISSAYLPPILPIVAISLSASIRRLALLELLSHGPTLLVWSSKGFHQTFGRVTDPCRQRILVQLEIQI